MKKIKAGTMGPERQRLFEELMVMRSGEHTGAYEGLWFMVYGSKRLMG